MSLSTEHRAKLRSSALSEVQIKALGWSTDHRDRLLIPYLKPDGSPEECHNGKPFHRWRCSDAWREQLRREGKAKPPKYLSPKGEGCRLYHSHLAISRGGYSERLNDRFIPLRITEGELKVEAATAHDPDRVTIGLGGVNSWRDRYDGGEESRPLVDWDEITLLGREVRLCFDSDLDKPQVAAALQELADFLSRRGARVLIEVLPHGLDGERLGIDDLIYRHGPALFRRIAAIARPAFKERRSYSSSGVTVHHVWAFTPEPADTRQRNTYLAGMLGPHWRRSPDGKDRWQQWNGCHWEEVAGDDELTAAIEGFAELQGWRNRELPVIRSLQAAFRRTVARSTEKATPGLIPFRNGALVLADMHLVPHDPAHGNSWCLPYDYNPAARCDGIEALLADRLGDAESVALFRAFARSLVVGERLKSFLEITGPGNTGKSVLANLLVALVGHENHAAGKLHRLEDATQRFETLNLRGKRLAVFSECQDYSGQLQMLKALTGGDSIAAEIKGGRHLAFTFTGGLVLTGNGPVRASDPTGAVINRRRTLRVTKVIPGNAERKMLEPDGQGGWSGELADELPGLVNWALAMPADQARLALARDVQSLARVEAELEALLDTDLLAAWANERLAWSPGSTLRVGNTASDAGEFLYASYLQWIHEDSLNGRPLALRTFKSKLVDLLRDTLGLPMPEGNPTGTGSGPYRERNVGSVVPCIRWRSDLEAEPVPGVIRHAFLARIRPPEGGTDEHPTGTEKQTPGTDAERIGNGENPVGNGWNGKTQDQETSREKACSPPPSGAAEEAVFANAASGNGKRVPSVPSIPHWGFAVPHPFPDPPAYRSAPPAGPQERPPADLLEAFLQHLRLHPGELPARIALALDPDGSRNVTGRRVKAWLNWLQAQPDEFADAG